MFSTEFEETRTDSETKITFTKRHSTKQSEELDGNLEGGDGGLTEEMKNKSFLILFPTKSNMLSWDVSMQRLPEIGRFETLFETKSLK